MTDLFQRLSRRDVPSSAWLEGWDGLCTTRCTTALTCLLGSTSGCELIKRPERLNLWTTESGMNHANLSVCVSSCHTGDSSSVSSVFILFSGLNEHSSPWTLAAVVHFRKHPFYTCRCALFHTQTAAGRLVNVWKNRDGDVDRRRRVEILPHRPSFHSSPQRATHNH